MGRPQTVITKEIYENAKKAIKKLPRISRVAKRLEILISSKENGITLAGKIFKVDADTIRIWSKRYKEEGINGLEYRPKKGRGSKINEEQTAELKKWIAEDNTLTLKKIIFKLKSKFGLDVSKSAVHRTLIKLRLAYIKPRPVHYKQDKEKQQEFKKKTAYAS